MLWSEAVVSQKGMHSLGYCTGFVVGPPQNCPKQGDTQSAKSSKEVLPNLPQANVGVGVGVAVGV